MAAAGVEQRVEDPLVSVHPPVLPSQLTFRSNGRVLHWGTNADSDAGARGFRSGHVPRPAHRLAASTTVRTTHRRSRSDEETRAAVSSPATCARPARTPPRRCGTRPATALSRRTGTRVGRPHRSRWERCPLRGYDVVGIVERRRRSALQLRPLRTSRDSHASLTLSSPVHTRRGDHRIEQHHALDGLARRQRPPMATVRLADSGVEPGGVDMVDVRAIVTAVRHDRVVTAHQLLEQGGAFLAAVRDAGHGRVLARHADPAVPEHQLQESRLAFRVAEPRDRVDSILSVQSHSSSAGLRP